MEDDEELNLIEYSHSKGFLEIIKEGSIKFYSFDPSKYSDRGKMLTKKMTVFYNPIQEKNRSFSLIVFKTYLESLEDVQEFYFCDSMAASGIRTLRLYDLFKNHGELETEYSPRYSYTINDLNPNAIELIKENMKLNELKMDSDDHHSFEVYHEDLEYLFPLLANKLHFQDIIDIDPFGSPIKYIEGALKSIRIGGMLAITATDNPVLFGIKKEACRRNYGLIGLRSSFLKEMGLRNLLYFTSIRAHTRGIFIEPILSFSSDHYIRVFIRVKKGAKGIDSNIKSSGYVFWCPHCDWRKGIEQTPNFTKNIFQSCPNCDKEIKMGGPTWIGNIFNKEFVGSSLQTLESLDNIVIPSKKKIEKLLKIMVEESTMPLGYYNVHKICDLHQLRVSSMEDIFNEIESQGFTASRTHIEPLAIKTDIGIEKLTEILKTLSH